MTVVVLAVTLVVVVVEADAIVASLDVCELVLTDLSVSVAVGAALPLAVVCAVVLLAGTGVACAFFWVRLSAAL